MLQQQTPVTQEKTFFNLIMLTLISKHVLVHSFDLILTMLTN